ncbi:MAG: hypothetical protein O2816_02620 [Planctomycetota bacterium]|nr:hypothetical protein [Planctomycetota bacterium]
MATLVVFTGLVGLVYATTLVSNIDVRESRQVIDAVRAEQLAEAGRERAMHLLGKAVQRRDFLNPIEGVEGLFGGEDSIQPFLGEPLMDGDAQVGAYSVRMTLDEATDTAVTITVESTGYLPDAPQNLPPGRRPTAWRASSTTVRLSLGPSDVFNYAYFINNWGWFYGNTIVCNGNARSNGQFDAAGYRPTVNGQPIYDGLKWNGGAAKLQGYHDDNGDGLEDGEDGGIYSGWDIVDAHKIRGNGGEERNQHEFLDQIPMPNLTDLTSYEEHALDQGASLSSGGFKFTGVYGDSPNEKGNLYLHGTKAKPIVIDGNVVVRGDVIISGYVKGQGAIYADGNVYCPNSIQYVKGPNKPRPNHDFQAQTQAWITSNKNNDFLGLFASENVVVGDHTHGLWQKYVKGWMGSSLNKSEEDAGEDGIPNTRAGRDGVYGTADDDLLEDDGIFTVQVYDLTDEELGLIPPGKKVGDVIPGSGEDIDGDGLHDDTTDYAQDMAFDDPLDTAHWGGNMPVGGIAKYSDIATLYANHFDATFYTNHSFAWLVLGSKDAVVNGAIISRNESIIYGTPEIIINYDCRLLGGGTGMLGNLLPTTMQATEVLRWRPLIEDPNRHAVPAADV